MEDDFVVVKRQNAIEVFPNDDGTITIRQFNWPDEDSFVIVAAEHVVALANGLVDTKKLLLESQNA